MPLANKLPCVSNVENHNYDVSRMNFNDVGLSAQSSPFISDCFRVCLSPKRSLSIQEQTCLMDCYKKNPTNRPFALLLWLPFDFFTFIFTTVISLFNYPSSASKKTWKQCPQMELHYYRKTISLAYFLKAFQPVIWWKKSSFFVFLQWYNK